MKLVPMRHERGHHMGLEDPSSLPKAASACWCRPQFVACGSPGCCCARGALHGPYCYLFWREQGRLRKRYVKPSEAPAVQAAGAAAVAQRRQQQQAVRQWRQTWRALAAELQRIEHGCDG